MTPHRTTLSTGERILRTTAFLLVAATLVATPLLLMRPTADTDDMQIADTPTRLEEIKPMGTLYLLTAYTEEYVDMIPAGIVDPTKVTRSALENAASIGACVLTTESLVVDKPDPAADAAANAAAAAQGGMY